MQQEDLQWLLGQAAEPLHQTNIQIILVPDFCHASVLFASSGMLLCGQLALDAEVTIRCRGPEKALRFSLLRSKQIKASQLAEPDSRVATFRIFMGTWKDAGGYTCRYHHKEHPFVWSNQSNPVELILRDPGLPRPSIQVRPSGQPALSMNVTIECQGPEKGLHFILLKSRERKASQWAEEDRSTAEFPLSLMSPEDAGTYACQYHRKGKRFLLSEPSDPVELRLRGERLALLSSHQPRPPERGVQPVWSYLWVPLQGATSQNRRVVES
uniref:Ig-like domain-containing protein n=1 Tax=Varanus komodoensis TaxID=61221 RepID=A0A8D2LIV0_VARKO